MFYIFGGVLMSIYDNKSPNIVYASDDGFAEVLGVSIISLYANNKEMDDINVFVLDSGISAENKRKLISISKEYNRRKIEFISAKNISEILKLDVKTDRGSLSQYARLFISSSLPKTIERVLYLDCDIVINGSILELWQMDMRGKTIAALKDIFSKQYRKNIGLKPNDLMFNSGVMLIDINKWIDNKIEKKLLEFIKAHKGVIQQGDQGALNAILSNDTCCFHPRYNSITVLYDFSYDEILIFRKPADFYSRNEIKEAVEKPVLIHYTTSFISVRPWVEGSTHPYKDVWLKFKKMSPWSETPLRKNTKAKGIKGVYSNMHNILPRKLYIHISGLLHAYGRPLVYSLKR